VALSEVDETQRERLASGAVADELAALREERADVREALAESPDR
jgi:hypothetical protein